MYIYNKKLFIFLSFLFILISLTYLLFSINKNNHEQIGLCFGINCFDVELALSPEDREQGLMFRDCLGKDKGMLFVFMTEKEYSFWMKNTLIPLDIIWLNKNKEIVFISENNQPCKNNDCPIIKTNKKAKYILELNGGMINKIDLKIGDKANFNIE